MTTRGQTEHLVVSVDDPNLARAIRHAADERQLSSDAVVAEALRQWLEQQEAAEDLAAIADAEGEPTVPWEEVKAKLRSARRAG